MEQGPIVKRINWDAQMREMMQSVPQGAPLLLHACCAPCTSAVLTRLLTVFRVTVFYYNPNIYPAAEYAKRREEFVKLRALGPFDFLEGVYEPDRFSEEARGLQDEPEGGRRCAVCFHMRLRETARLAGAEEFPYFATTLSVSPHKNAATLNETGEAAAGEYGVHFLPADFKKRDGYAESVRLSRECGLYRQGYCGCAPSLAASAAASSEARA